MELYSAPEAMLSNKGIQNDGILRASLQKVTAVYTPELHQIKKCQSGGTNPPSTEES